MAITAQEAWTERDAGVEVTVPALLRELIEEVAIQARRASTSTRTRASRRA